MANGSMMMLRVFGPNGQVKRITVEFHGEIRMVENGGDHIVTVDGATRVSQTEEFALPGVNE